MNHCFNDTGFTQYEGFIQLHDDGNLVKITTKVPKLKYKVIQNSKELCEEQKNYADYLKKRLYEFNKDRNVSLDLIEQKKNTEFENDDFLEF